MKKQNGFTVVEIIVAMTLLVIIVFAFAPALAFYYKQITVASQGEQHIFEVNEDLNEQLALRARDGADNPFDLTFSGTGVADIDGKVFGRDLAADGVTTFEAAQVDAEGRVKFGISVRPNLIVAAYDDLMTVTATFKIDNIGNFKLVDKSNTAVSGAVFSIINDNEAEMKVSNVAFHPDKSPYTVIYRGADENGTMTDFQSSFEIIPYPYMVATADGQYYYGSLNTAGDLKLIDMKDQIASGSTPGGGSKMGAATVIDSGAATPARPRIVSDLIWDGQNYVAGAIGVLGESRSDDGDYPPRLAVMNDLHSWKTLKDLGSNMVQNRIYEARRLVPLVNGGFAALGRYLDPEKYNRTTFMTVGDSGIDIGDIMGSPDLLYEEPQYKDGAKTLLINSGLYLLAGQHREWVDNDNVNFNRGIILVNIDGVDIDFKEVVSLLVSSASQYLPGKPQNASNYTGYYTGGDVGNIDGNYGFIFTTYKRWVSNGEYEPGAIIALTLDADEVKFDLSLCEAFDANNKALVDMQSFEKQYGYNDIAFGGSTVVANPTNQTENWIVVGERGLLLYRDKSNVNRFQQTTAIYDGGAMLEPQVRETLQFTRAAFYEGSFYAMGYRGEVSQSFAADGSRTPTPAPQVVDGKHYAVLYQSKDGGRTWHKVEGLNSGFMHSNGNTYATEVVGIARS
jgi:hypothetical protein